jgi:hypothetical protein
MREIMQVGERIFKNKIKFFRIAKESLIIKSLFKNLKFYLKKNKILVYLVDLINFIPIFAFAKMFYDYKIPI